jgi:hypothetical protein
VRSIRRWRFRPERVVKDVDIQINPGPCALSPRLELLARVVVQRLSFISGKSNDR